MRWAGSGCEATLRFSSGTVSVGPLFTGPVLQNHPCVVFKMLLTDAFYKNKKC